MIKQSGESWFLGNEYVIIKTGRRKGWVCYLMMLTWPASASAQDRINDKRFTFVNEVPMVLMSNGEYQEVSSNGTAYYFSGDGLKIMSLHVKEKDLPLFSPDKYTDADAVWDFLKQYSNKEY